MQETNTQSHSGILKAKTDFDPAIFKYFSAQLYKTKSINFKGPGRIERGCKENAWNWISKRINLCMLEVKENLQSLRIICDGEQLVQVNQCEYFGCRFW